MSDADTARALEDALRFRAALATLQELDATPPVLTRPHSVAPTLLLQALATLQEHKLLRWERFQPVGAE